MLISKVAKRYAKGFLDFSQEIGATSTTYGEMKDIVDIMNVSKELQAFFATPFIDYKKKMSVSGEIFASFSQPTKNMIYLVIKQGRETHLKNIAQEYINKVEDMEGIQRITLTTATQLSPSNVEAILKSSGLFQEGKQFDLKTIVKPEILGGYIVRVGDQQIDASVKTKLNTIRKDFQIN